MDGLNIKQAAPRRLSWSSPAANLRNNVRQGDAGHAGIGHNRGVTALAQEDGNRNESVKVVAWLELDREASLLDNIE